MKKVLSLALALIMVFSLCSFSAYADNPVVKIGVFEPQSGDNGAGGKQETLGVHIRALLEKSYLYDSLFSVTEVKKRFWDQLARPINHNQNILLRTQDLPPIYEENSCIHIFTRQVLEKKHTRIGDRPLLFPIPAREAQDIDDEFEFAVTELMMKLVR